jgi:hypothetical protein
MSAVSLSWRMVRTVRDLSSTLKHSRDVSRRFGLPHYYLIRAPTTSWSPCLSPRARARPPQGGERLAKHAVGSPISPDSWGRSLGEIPLLGDTDSTARTDPADRYVVALAVGLRILDDQAWRNATEKTRAFEASITLQVPDMHEFDWDKLADHVTSLRRGEIPSDDDEPSAGGVPSVRASSSTTGRETTTPGRRRWRYGVKPRRGAGNPREEPQRRQGSGPKGSARSPSPGGTRARSVGPSSRTCRSSSDCRRRETLLNHEQESAHLRALLPGNRRHFGASHR